MSVLSKYTSTASVTPKPEPFTLTTAVGGPLAGLTVTVGPAATTAAGAHAKARTRTANDRHASFRYAARSLISLPPSLAIPRCRVARLILGASAAEHSVQACGCGYRGGAAARPPL